MYDLRISKVKKFSKTVFDNCVNQRAKVFQLASILPHRLKMGLDLLYVLMAYDLQRREYGTSTQSFVLCCSGNSSHLSENE